jgi:ribosomal protein L29
MKASEKKQLAGLSIAELIKKAAEIKRQIIDDTYKRSHEQVKNVRFIGSLKKKLAVMQTLIRAAELGQKGNQ